MTMEHRIDALARNLSEAYAHEPEDLVDLLKGILPQCPEDFIAKLEDEADERQKEAWGE